MIKSNKVIRDGKVAILISHGFGAGWYTWNTEFPDCLTNPRLVDLVAKLEIARSAKQGVPQIEQEIETLAKELYGEGFYTGGVDDLTIHWVPEGTAFEVTEYDGAEGLTTTMSLPLVA